MLILNIFICIKDIHGYMKDVECAIKFILGWEREGSLNHWHQTSLCIALKVMMQVYKYLRIQQP